MALCIAATPDLHPAVVHFPIALLVAALVLDLVAAVGKNDGMARAGGIVLLMAAAGAVAAVVTGMVAEEAAEAMLPNEPLHETLEQHELAAFIVTALALALAVWRLAGKLQLPKGARRWVYLALLLAAVVLVGATGYLGGQLVYVHGVGIPH
jgi:uncharacterized membrane protein